MCLTSVCLFFGGWGEDRTPGQLVKSQMLYHWATHPTVAGWLCALVYSHFVRINSACFVTAPLPHYIVALNFSNVFNALYVTGPPLFLLSFTLREKRAREINRRFVFRIRRNNEEMKFFVEDKNGIIRVYFDVVVELQGLEPWTPCLQSRCSSHLSYSPVWRN